MNQIRLKHRGNRVGVYIHVHHRQNHPGLSVRFILQLILWLILSSLVLLATAAWFAFADTPIITVQRPLSHEDIARTLSIIRRNDPRGRPAGSRQTIRVTGVELNLAVGYLLQSIEGAARVDVRDGAADLVATVRIPYFSVRPYLNAYLTIEDSNEGLRYERLRFGQVPIPGILVDLVVHSALGRVYGASRYRLVEELVQNLNFRPGLAMITYEWQPELIERARDSLLTDSVREALAAYRNHLAHLHAKGAARHGSLAEALRPLFVKAQQRSLAKDPVEENRALLLVLGAWTNGRGMDKLVPHGRRRGRLTPYGMSLEGRRDLGQHFLTSAALASAADTTLSDAVGLFKELKDAKYGSGFSFTDLAADHAGTRFGELATASAEQARWIQKTIAAGIKEMDIMPSVRGLPESMNQAEFKRRFGSAGSTRYNRIKKEIDKRLAACRLHRGAWAVRL